MELVCIYIEEHKIIKNLMVSFSSKYDINLVDKTLNICNKEDSTFDYYSGCNIKAIVGQNGTGKSSLLDFIEESCAPYTESSGFIVWHNHEENTFLIHEINGALSNLEINSCLNYKIIIKNKRYFVKSGLKVFKINNMSSVGLSGVNRKKYNVIDCSLGTQSKFRGKKRTVNLGRMLDFFNNSAWLKNKQAKYSYIFEFKKPSKAIHKWVFSLVDEFNKGLSDLELKKMHSNYEMELFDVEPIFSPRETSEVEHVFQGLIKRNIYSFIKAMPSMKIASTKVAGIICFELINKGMLSEKINYMNVIDIVKTVHKEHSKKNGYGTYDLFDFNEVLELYFSKFFKSLLDMSHTICRAASYKSKSYGDKLESNNHDVIMEMLESLTRLDACITNNFQYGWEGFSTGELAKLNIFSSLYNIHDEYRGSSALVIIDEVDLFLHPEWQRTFLSELISFINETNFNVKLQIILTTHSPIIIGDFLPKDIISLHLNKDGETEIVESFGFGTGITESYVLGMHIKSTYGELSRLKLTQLINNKVKGVLSEQDKIFIEQISNVELKESMLK